MDHPEQPPKAEQPAGEQLPYVSLDTAITLSFDYLKHLGSIAMTAAGGLIALAQFVDGDKKFYIKIMVAAGMMFLSALMAFFVQYSLMDRIRQSHEVLRASGQMRYTQKSAKKTERLLEGGAMWLLSISIGVALQALFSGGMP
jgi:hypothetical protein